MIYLKSFSKNIRDFSTHVFIVIFILSALASVNSTTVFALSIPQPTYPGNSSTTTPVTDPPLGIPLFSWTSVEGATKYRLQVDSEIGFNTPIFLDKTTSNTSYTPSETNKLFADGTWYWRVRVEVPAPVGEWSDTFEFTKTWATLDNKPTNLLPEDGTTLAFLESNQFSWSTVVGAAKYRFQIASSPDGFATPILSSDTLTTTHQTSSLFENGTYYWRVIPMDAASHFGTISDILSVTFAYGTIIPDTLTLIPTLLTPGDESFPVFTPSFHWTAVEGTQFYRLEYTTEENCDFSVGTSLITRQTYYDPVVTFPNDVRYCWHVRAESDDAVGDWSDTWHFQKKWYLQPQLLTPTNLFQNDLYPVFSWTPVPGAARYRIDIDTDPGFTPPLYESVVTANTTYVIQDTSIQIGNYYYYWRVTPIDGGGELGLSSAVSELYSKYDSLAPMLVYPLYYYIPNDPVYYGEHALNPYEDRTVAYPIFMWHRVMVPSPNGGVYANAYRIQVDTEPYFNNIVWQYDTENTSATPTNENDFTPLIDQDYFWRVCVLNFIGGTCNTGPTGGWSQIWRVRFNPDYGSPDHPNPWALPPTTGDVPVLLRPAHGHESVEATPLLEWFPMQDTIQYQVQVSRDSSFSTYEIDELVNHPAFSTSVSLAQRNLNHLDYGTFYWRVRGFDGSQWSDWSGVRRFQVASQSEWRYSRSLGDPANRLQIGDDPGGDATLTYDLENMHVSQQGGTPASWFFGFTANLTSTDMTYVFYIDLDHVDGSGGSFPPPAPRDYSVTTIPAHQPEFAIYVDKNNGSVDANNTWVYAWNGSAWGYGQRLSDIGGQVYAYEDYVELRLLNATIGMSQVTGSASVMLFSVDPATNQLVDSVPTDPQVPGNGQLSRFSAVSERMNLIYTPNRNSGSGTEDPRTYSSILPYYWDWPTGSYPSVPWAGNKTEVHLDPGYTNLVDDFQETSDAPYYAWNSSAFLSDFIGDTIYYWRVQPWYDLPNLPAIYGAWTGGWSFRRLGFTAQNLQISVNWATPTFSWDMAEGARTYRLQVSTDPNFGSPVINITTPLTSYTPTATLAQGQYYWRVQVTRYNGVENDWSTVQQFNLTLPSPTGLSPNGDIVHYAPTLCWDPLIEYNDQEPYEPILTAWKYRIQVSRDENFSTIYDDEDVNHTCWTPTKGYADGPYYWHVAMIDGNGKLGPYSTPAATFTKQYPITTLVSPIGEPMLSTPTFIWTPVNGASVYRFEVSKFPTFTPTYDSVTTINTQYTPTNTYDRNVVYYWRVAIQDRDGNQGPFTDSTIIIDPGRRMYLPFVTK